MSDPFKVHFLGTGSAAPTTKRFPTSQMVEFRQKNFLIDCGEGAQIQIRRNKLKFSRIVAVFISHLHGDHCFGLPGLISTLGLLGRTADLHIYAHEDLQFLMNPWLSYFSTKVNYNIVFHAVETRKYQLIYEDRSVEVYSLPLKHRIPCCGYLFREKPRPANIRVDAIAKYSLTVPEITKIKAGADLLTEEGHVVPHSELAHPSRALRSYAYCSDTQYKESLIEQLKDVTLLYHEATFLKEDQKIAHETGHSTATDAARIAQQAGVEQLVIGHFSARYTDDDAFRDEASSVFSNVQIATDNLTLEIL